MVKRKGSGTKGEVQDERQKDERGRKTKTKTKDERGR
jgi:hypothetical protein